MSTISYMSYEKQRYKNFWGEIKERVVNSMTEKADDFSKEVSKYMKDKENIKIKINSYKKKSGFWYYTWSPVE